jgi:hypothetical protein
VFLGLRELAIQELDEGKVLILIEDERPAVLLATEPANILVIFRTNH